MNSSISIVIPTCNRINRLLSSGLPALLPQLQNTNIEVIVSDDGDTDLGALFKKQFPTVKYYRSPKKGPAANRNYGAKQAQGNWLIFLDDDVITNENFIANYRQAINNFPEARAFEGAIHPDDWTACKKDMVKSGANLKGGCFFSANIMIERNIFFESGCFDEDFLIAYKDQKLYQHEDQELYYRLSKKTKIPFVFNSIVIHPVSFQSIKYELRVNQKKILIWLLYQQKTNVSFDKIIARAYVVHFKQLYKNILSGRFKSALHNIHTFIIFPIACFKFYTQKKKLY